MQIAGSLSFDQDVILKDIIRLYCEPGVELDATFGRGNFWKTVGRPKLCYDINPLPPAEYADCRSLPVRSESISSMIFDPPFVCSTSSKGIIQRRFSYFDSVKNLWKFYDESLKEFYRVLKPDGTLVIKCQDTIDGRRQYLSHVHLINEAERLGFYCVDIFILAARCRPLRPLRKQMHARKFHLYFLVFLKRKPGARMLYRGPEPIVRSSAGETL